MSVFNIEKVKERNISLDIIKCIGVLFITNAHSWDLWEVVDKRIATGGVQGVSFFFFVSGFAMMIGSTRCKSFVDFVRDKIKRLWPPLIVWSIIANALWSENITCETFLALEFRYWFISCIFIYYIITYFLVKRSVSTMWKTAWGG
jgi:peptidoglycan/LPS O-acetylase OafA/YrhL